METTINILLRTLGSVMLACALAGASAVGQEEAGHDDEHALAMKLQNPVAALISVPFQNNFEWGAGRRSEGFRYLLNFQPVIPISISENWNLISRTIVPVIHQLIVAHKCALDTGTTVAREFL